MSPRMKWMMARIAERLFLLLNPLRRKLRGNRSFQDIAILFLPSLGIGDLIMISPFIFKVAEHFPDRRIYLITRHTLLFDLPDNVIVKTHIDAIPHPRHTLLISPSLSLNHARGLIRFPMILGYFLSTRLLSTIQRDTEATRMAPGKRHYLHRTLPLLNQLEIPYDADNFAYPALKDHKAEPSLPSNYLTATPFCLWQEKRLPQALMQRFLTDLLIHHPIVLLGAPNPEEQHYNQAITEALSGSAPHDIIDLTGLLSLQESIHVMRHGLGHIANDSGPAHLACLSAPRTLVFFGCTKPELLLPLNTATRRTILAVDSREACPVYSCFDGLNNPTCSQSMECMTQIDWAAAKDFILANNAVSKNGPETDPAKSH